MIILYRSLSALISTYAIFFLSFKYVCVCVRVHMHANAKKGKKEKKIFPSFHTKIIIINEKL